MVAPHIETILIYLPRQVRGFTCRLADHWFIVPGVAASRARDTSQVLPSGAPMHR